MIGREYKNTHMIDYLCCPQCKSDLEMSKNTLVCFACDATYKIKDGIPILLKDLNSEKKLSLKKWDTFYDNLSENERFNQFADMYYNDHFPGIYDQLNAAKPINNINYLEIGCGPFLMGQRISESCTLVIGIDFSFSALKLAKMMLDKKRNTNYLLIQADILDMPIKSNVIDLIYGGGVIEHFKDTQTIIDELYRVLAASGVTCNSVPCFNLAALYRQKWGNIPNVPVLKQMAEFLHIKVLKGRHMTFGYELSFLSRTIKNIHKKSGFNEVLIKRFNVPLTLEFIPDSLKRPVTWLALNCSLFWPMIFVVGKK